MLQVNNISFSYKTTPVFKDISFSVKPGEHLSVIGESGSGKSTLLKLIYGVHNLNQGHIYWKETEILGPEHNLIIGYDFMKSVTQEFDLMPYTSVAENVGKYLSNTAPNLKMDRIAELLQVVELSEFSKIKVKFLSGGQKQRVALARAIAKQPEIMLMDEPFSHIDNFKKQSLRRSLFRYLKEKNIACIVATHHSEDVLGYADTMIVLDNAKIMANDTPNALYNDPKNHLIASFFGEFNELENQGIVYANQLKIVEKSSLQVTVVHSYYKGNFYLIEAKLNQHTVFFQHFESINKDAVVYLNVENL
jgi:ABC-type Fe3+/spermidine/putrescine transport system ATPase subunit